MDAPEPDHPGNRKLAGKTGRNLTFPHKSLRNLQFPKGPPRRMCKGVFEG